MHTTATARLARFAAALDYRKLQPEVRHQVVRLIYDALTCAVAGESAAATGILNPTLLSLGREPQATIIPGGDKTSAPQASFLNAMSANALDLDDNLLYHTHIGNTIIATAVAMGEFLNSSGKELIAAVAAGYEVASRITLSMPGVLMADGKGKRKRIISTNPNGFSYNTIGAAVAAGRLLALDQRRMAHAIGLAAYSAPVPSAAKAMSADRFALCKPGMFGWQAWSGCVAGLLAAKGLETDSSVLDGPFGYWKMSGAVWVDHEILAKSLGTKWWLMDVSFKLEAAGTWMRPAIRALRMIMDKHAFSGNEIEKIDAFVHALGQNNLFHQTRPKSYLDAQVSYHYLLAATALRIPIEEWQLPRVYKSKPMQDMLHRIELHPDAASTKELCRELSVRPHRATGVLSTVRVRARGKVFSENTKYGAGDPFDPEARATDSDMDEKFKRFAGPILGRKAARVPSVLWNLEHGTTARQLAKAFSHALQ